MGTARPSVTKRQREQVKRERKKLKEEKRAQRKIEGGADESEFTEVVREQEIDPEEFETVRG